MPDEFEIVLYLETQPDLQSVNKALEQIQKQVENNKKIKVELDINSQMKKLNKELERGFQSPLHRALTKVLNKGAGAGYGRIFGRAFADTFGGTLKKSVGFMSQHFGLRMPMTRVPSGDYSTGAKAKTIMEMPSIRTGEARYYELFQRFLKKGAKLDDTMMLLYTNIKSNNKLTKEQRTKELKALQQVYTELKVAFGKFSSADAMKKAMSQVNIPKLQTHVEALKEVSGKYEKLGLDKTGQLRAMSFISKTAEGSGGMKGEAVSGFGKLSVGLGKMMGMFAVLPLIGQMISGIFAILSVIADNPLFGSLMKMFKAFMKMVGTLLIMPLYIMLYPVLRIMIIVMGWILRAVMPIFVKIMQAINAFFKDPIGALKALGGIIVNGIYNGLVWLGGAVVNGIIALPSAILNGIKYLLGLAVQGLIIVFIKLPKMIGAFIWSAIKWGIHLITGAINFIINIFRPVFNAVSGMLQGIWNGILAIPTLIGNAIHGAVQFITNIINGVINVIASIPAAIGAFIDNIINTFKSMIQGIWDTISGVLTSISNFAKDFVKKIMDGLKNTFKWITDVAGTIGGAIKGFFGSVTDFISNIAKGIGDVIKGIFTGVGDSIKNAGNWLWDNTIGRVYQTGGTIPTTGWYYMHANEKVIPPSGEQNNNTVYAPTINVNVSGESSQSAFFAEDLANTISEKIMEDLKRRGVFG